jgi:hypothetical protein
MYPLPPPSEQQAKGRFLLGGIRRSLFNWTDPPLRLPPDPPLLSGNAIEPVLRDVGLLLDYLNRLPEMRLERCFQSANQQSGMTQISRYNPPCASQSYFLTRITAIAALEDKASATMDITEPQVSNMDGSKQIESGAGEAAHLGNLAFLIWSRDLLSALASPATLDTIRVTRAFRAGRMMNSRRTKMSKPIIDTADERDLFMSQYGLRISIRVGRFQVLAMFLLWFSVYISVMVYSRQVLLTENTKLQADISSFNTRLSDAVSEEDKFVRESLTVSHNSNNISLFAIQYCDISRSIIAPIQYIAVDSDVNSSLRSSTSTSVDLIHELNPSLPGSRVFISNKQRMLCNESQELNERKNELRRSEGSWVEAASPVIAVSTPLPGILYFVRTLWREVFFWNNEPPPRALETQRYAMQQLLNGLLAGIMPAMYAALGALVSLFRRLAIMAEKEMLGPAEYGGMMSSLVLGGLTGAVIGLFSNVVPQGEQSAGLPLATTALALLAGYAADQVFAMFDSLARRVFVFQAESDGKKSG